MMTGGRNPWNSSFLFFSFSSFFSFSPPFPPAYAPIPPPKSGPERERERADEQIVFGRRTDYH